jgi:transcriptional regulator with XRE-family HTH domain
MAISYVDVGRRLKAWRVAASLNAEDVSDRLGLSRAAVYRLERGEIVKIEVLEKVAALLNVSLALLMGVEVEYYPRASDFFERMRQLEENCDQILAHFEPVSFLLTSDAYPDYLRAMLLEAIPADLRATQEAELTNGIDEVMDILRQRKLQFGKKRANIVSLVGTREIERFLHVGLVGRLSIPTTIHTMRIEAAKREMLHMADLIESEPMGVQIGVVDDTLPPFAFQIFRQPDREYVAVSAFRLGELPNTRTGVATVTSSHEAVALYTKMMTDLWQRSHKGREGAAMVRQLVHRI